LLDRVYYYDRSTQKYIHLRDDPEYGESFRAACTITKEEALAMNLDRNTNVDPTEYYIYDMTEEPGTYHGSN